ncbi:ATP-binding protein [Nonomuraea sp. NPDC050663]|uniref:ATP-binding protein n=1 Tax=Nonomuraea sp. NPDC050663 TaxID=3364370 RepID=UPI00378A3BF3
MGDPLRILLLGPPDLLLGDRPLPIRSAKARALLYYLAATRTPRSRAELAGLLWGERPDARARGSLRLAVLELRRDAGAWLDISRDRIALRLGPGCFVDHAALAGEPGVEQALRLWRGDFLDGVGLDDAPAFTAWLEGERQRTRLMLRQVVLRHAGHPDAALVRLARVLTALDPLDEEAGRLLMAALAGTGNRAAALTSYEALRRGLREELGVAPAPETVALREELARAGGREELARAGGRAAPGVSGRAGLPVPRTSLVGRRAEIEQVLALLVTERLVTLHGPGGVGKTRLAIAAAQRWDGEGERAFVSFVGVHAEAVVTTLARRLGVDLSPPRPAEDLLVAALADRPVLLVLDNLDHLPGFDVVLARVLRAAPGVRVLATSRRRPAVPEQVCVAVRGLAGPTAEALFAERAQTASPWGQVPKPGGSPALVAAVCAATGGLPLAIELAASLLRALPLEEVARRLATDPDLLAAPESAPRRRHGSLRAVFEASWRLLDPPAQQALAALSVFRGGFTLDAALEVAPTSWRVLVRLADHCMIHLDPAGRYHLHPIIQQYAGSHLPYRAEPEVVGRHTAYFARLLRGHAVEDGLDGAAARILGAELDNLRLALARGDGDPSFLDRYWTLCLRLRLYEEGLAVLSRRLERTADPSRLRARWLRLSGVMLYQLGRDPDAAGHAVAALRALDRDWPASAPALMTALVRDVLGHLWQRAGVQGVLGHLWRRTRGRDVLSRLWQRAPAALGQVRRQRARGGGCDPDAAEAAQALALIALLAYRRHDLAAMLAASAGQANTAWRSGDAALRAEAYAHLAISLRVAGRRRLADRIGHRADTDLVRHAVPSTAGPAPSRHGVPPAGPVPPRHEFGHGDAADRARLARGLSHLNAGRLREARLVLTECRGRTVDPRLAETCAGLLAETAVWQGDFAAARDLFAETAELAASRVGDEVGRHWCLTGTAETLLRIDGTDPGEILAILERARAAEERRRTHGALLGVRDDPAARLVQEIRLLTATARLHARPGPPSDRDPRATLAELDHILALAARLPRTQPGMIECWSGLAELAHLHASTPDRAARRRLRVLDRHLARYIDRYPGAAARLGWGRALLHQARGHHRRAGAHARRALAAATRMDVAYDAGRAATVSSRDPVRAAWP